MIRKYGILLVLGLLLSLGLGSQAQDEQELILEQGLDGYQGVEDTTIYSENGNSNGGGSHVFVGVTRQMGNERRALVRFDLSQIPRGATITFARLELFVSRVPSGAQPSTINVHRVTADWGEGSTDAPAQEGRGAASSASDATWRENFNGSSSWKALGGDFDPQSSAFSVVQGSLGRPSWQGQGLIADVQDWLSTPARNFGWILISGEEAKRFHSSNGSAGTGMKPRLTIRYTTP